MKEHPIIFSGEMVRAILEGRKTQTRWVIKPPPEIKIRDIGEDCSELIWSDKKHCLNIGGGLSQEQLLRKIANDYCPYGKIGDRLWVREAWWKAPPITIKMLREGADTWSKVYYAVEEEESDLEKWGWRKMPSIHMPRWASRLTLEIINISIERVQEINEKDAGEEGIEIIKGMAGDFYRDYSHINARAFKSPILSFCSLWNSINAKHGFGWDTNPWVWVIEFKRVEC